MSTTVPIVAIGGMTLHPGPGPFAAGPGPFPLRSRCSSSADAVAAKTVTARAADNAMTPRNRRKRCELGCAGDAPPCSGIRFIILSCEIEGSTIGDCHDRREAYAASLTRP